MMDHGIDDSDPFGVGALFLSQSLAHRFGCEREVDDLMAALLAIETPDLPDVELAPILAPIDALLDRIEPVAPMIELVSALLELGTDTPPRSEVSQRLYRAVLWVMLRHDPERVRPRAIAMLRAATPGARFQRPDWPRHEFFALVVALVCLGGEVARSELVELAAAAGDLGYHDLTPILDAHLDYRPSVPAR